VHGRIAGVAVYTARMRTPPAILGARPLGRTSPAGVSGARAALRLACLVGTLVGAACWTTPALAQWKWRDASGQVTASDRPPPKEIPDKDILGRPQAPAGARRSVAAAEPVAAVASAAASAPRAAARGGLEGEVDARRQAAARENAAKAAAQEQKDKEQRAENCRRARAQMAALDSGQRLTRFNDKGEREVLDDKGRADETLRVRQSITENCR
jgi:hypothetical protein